MKPYSMRTRNRVFNKTFVTMKPGMKVIPIIQPKNKFSIPNIWDDFLDMVMDFFRPRKAIFTPAPVDWNPVRGPEPRHMSRPEKMELIRHGHWRGAHGTSKREQRRMI